MKTKSAIKADIINLRKVADRKIKCMTLETNQRLSFKYSGQLYQLTCR